MSIVGYFADLDEARKFVQSKLLAGVVQEIYEVGQLLPMLPVFTIDGKSLKYLRQTTPPAASFYDIHEQIPFTAQATGDEYEVVLKRVSQAAILDNFMMDTYKDPNDYRTIILSGLNLGNMRTIEDKLIYGDIDNDAAEFDGIGHLFEQDAADGDGWAGTYTQQFDMGANALSLMRLRELIQAVKPKPDILLMTQDMQNLLSAAAFERGITVANASPGGVILMTKNEFGERVASFDGIRIVISDYLKDEDDNYGDKASSVTSLISIFAIRFGQIMDGGLSLATGGQGGGVNLFRLDEIPVMEDYDAEGLRLTAYVGLALGSSKGLGRIHSIDRSSAVTA